MLKMFCGFIGVGKTTLADSDKISYRDYNSDIHEFISTPDGKVNNFEYPNNYIDYVIERENRLGVSASLLTESLVLRESLHSRNIPYVIVIPELSFKQKYLERFSNIELMKRVSSMYESSITSCMEDANKLGIIYLNEDNPYLRSEQISNMDKLFEDWYSDKKE